MLMKMKKIMMMRMKKMRMRTKMMKKNPKLKAQEALLLLLSRIFCKLLHLINLFL